jgi:AcrR family transcriptional regulator
MSEKRPVRKPRQSRGIESKSKIVETALKVFTDKGYFQTDTDEIAKAAGVSIGCLYSYFKDKDALFCEIMKCRNDKFIEIFTSEKPPEMLSKNDMKMWLNDQIVKLISFQRESKRIRAEIRVLSYTNPELASFAELQRKIRMQTTIDFLSCQHEKIRIDDLEAAAILVNDIISVVAEQIAFRENVISDDRILHASVDALMKYLYAE